MTEAALDSAGAKFLVALDAVVQSDTQPPGFSGKVAFGIRDGDRDLWWFAEAAASISTSFTTAEPTGADVSVLLGTYELKGFMKTGRFPADASTIVYRGDVLLFQRLMDRYSVSRSMVDVRASATKGKGRRRR
jgi:hypothetical protein